VQGHRALVLVLVAGLGGGGSALADPPPVNVPAVDAYVEVLPTAGGGAAVGAGPARSGRLPRALDRRLRRAAGKQAPVLEQIATSSRYGAPPVQRRPVRQTPPRTRRPAPAGGGRTLTPPPPPPAAPVRETVDGGLDLAALFTGRDGARMIGLGAVMLASALAALAVSGLRRREP